MQFHWTNYDQICNIIFLIVDVYPTLSEIMRVNPLRSKFWAGGDS